MAKSETDPETESEKSRSPLQRLAYLGGAASAVGLAGCLGDDEDEDDDDDDEVVDPDPAYFEVSNLDPADETLEVDEEVTVSADVTNTGEETETKAVELRIDGTTQASEDLELGEEDSESVSFTVSLAEEGTYEHAVWTEDDSASGQLTVEADPEPPEPDDVQLSMVIDLQRCTGCQGCNIACKSENNVEEGHAWADRITVTNGEFPDASYEFVPTLCNHCDDAPCIDVCPAAGDALYKGPGGITMQNRDECIGCEACVGACPYDKVDFNDPDEETQAFWRGDDRIMTGTATPLEVTEECGAVPPYQNRSRDSFEGEYADRGDAEGADSQGTAEKCTFCVHRVTQGELPACVEACPSDARIFGDLNDADSTVSQLVDEYDDRIVDEWYGDDFGTDPNVFYIRQFDGSEAGEPLPSGKGEVPELD